MHLARTDHGAPSINSGPQITAAAFAVLLIFMLLLPFAHVSFEGAAEPRLLISLLKTDFGINIFALVLLLSIPAGIAVSMLLHSVWDLAAMITAAVGVLMIPLALVVLRHETSSVPSIGAHITPDIGAFVLAAGLAILAIATGVTTFRAHR